MVSKESTSFQHHPVWMVVACKTMVRLVSKRDLQTTLLGGASSARLESQKYQEQLSSLCSGGRPGWREYEAPAELEAHGCVLLMRSPGPYIEALLKRSL